MLKMEEIQQGETLIYEDSSECLKVVVTEVQKYRRNGQERILLHIECMNQHSFLSAEDFENGHVRRA